MAWGGERCRITCSFPLVRAREFDIYKPEELSPVLQRTPLSQATYKHNDQLFFKNMSTPAELKARLLADREARRLAVVARREAEARREEEEARELERLEELEREEEERRICEEAERREREREETEKRLREEEEVRRVAERKVWEEAAEKRLEEQKKEEERRQMEMKETDGMQEEEEMTEAKKAARLALLEEKEAAFVAQRLSGSSKGGALTMGEGCWHCRSRAIECQSNG